MQPKGPIAPRRRPRRRARWIVGILTVASVWLVLAALSLNAARAEIDAGRSAIGKARAHTSADAISEGKPLPDLRSARASFARARAKSGGLAVGLARVLPILGRQVRSAQALSGAATVVCDVAIEAVGEAQRALKLPHRSGAERIALLRRVEKVASSAERRLSGLRFGPENGLIAPLRRGRAELSGDVEELLGTVRAGRAAAGGVADLLEGPSRTLVFAANNAEMRAGSGMLLSNAELRARNGEFSLGAMVPAVSVPVPRGSVPLDGDMAARWGWLTPNEEWFNLMLSPRFDASAELAAKMWAAAGKGRVDGVMVMDPRALRGILAATGPVVANGRSVGADNIEQELLLDQYILFSSDNERRRSLIGGIAAAAVRALSERDWSPVGLIKELAEAAGGRHIMMWSADDERQAAWRDAGVAGLVNADSLLVSVLNRGGNKLDRFLTVRARLDVSPARGGTDATLRLDLRNSVPEGVPAYIAGGQPALGIAVGEYVGILSVSLPGAAGGARIEGVRRLAVAGPDGPTRVIGFRVSIPRGRSRSVVVRFRFAGEHGSMQVEPSARIPPIEWSFAGGEWSDEGPRRISW